LLFRRELDPAEANAWGEQVHSAEHDLLAYLRSRDTRAERLPMEFVANLQRALAHYGLRSLEPSPALDESLLLMYKSHQQINQHLATVITMLERRLEHVDELAFLATGEMHLVLDRLLLAMRERYPAVYDLAREVRFRYFEKPLFESARDRVYEEVQSQLSYIAAHPDTPNRDELIYSLVACPQPLQNLLTRRFAESGAKVRLFMLEVLARRYYRIRLLEDFESTTIDGHPFVKAAYDDEGRRVIVVTTFSLYADFVIAAATMSHFVSRFSAEHDIVADFYTWRSEPLRKDEATSQEIREVLDQTSFPQALQRIVVAVNAPGKDLSMASTQHFTYRPGENGYQEDYLYRGLHPMMGERHHIWRLANFQIERLPSAEDIYLFHGIARDNPKDERLFALAEVRDMTPLRDESGQIIQIPHLERMLMEALESIRLYQSHLPTHKRLPWNRVLLYVWPPLEQQPEEFPELMRKLWPATEGLGLERIVVHAKIAEPGTGELRSRMLHISNPAGRELVLRESGTIETPIATLSEYRQKVVQYFSTRPEDSDFTCLGDLFSDEKNTGRKRAFDIRTVMRGLIDTDHQPLERWHEMRDADTVVVWDVHLGGYPVAMLGIESRPLPRHGFIPGDGPEQWTAGTLFPLSAKKAARAINSASGNRPLVVIANLSGFDGSPESLHNLVLEYGAEIGRAITNFKGPIVFCVVSRYHGGSFVVFSKALNENLEVAAVAGSYASVIGGVPAAAVVFAREVDTRTKSDPRVKALQEQIVQADDTQKAALQVKLNEISSTVRSEKVGEVASEFDHIHNVQRAQRVGSIDHVIPPEAIRPYLIEALERGIERELQRTAG
jgi:Carboxyl transferase domain/Acetyl-CoA carboxylase, central region